MQRPIDDARPLAPWRHENVAKAGKRLERQGASCEHGMTGSKETSKRIFEERSALKLSTDLETELERIGTEEHGMNREVDLSRLEAVGQPLRGGHDRDID